MTAHQKRSDKIEPTRVEITTRDGATYSKEVEHPLGSPERPMSFDDCAEKFRDCAGQIGVMRSDKVIELIGVSKGSTTWERSWAS